MTGLRGRFQHNVRILFFVFLALLLAAATGGANERKVALVIGNGAYDTATVTPLTNPPNDAHDVTGALREIGFDARTVIDGTHEEMAAAVDRFTSDLRDAEVGLFYYAGHGVQVDGRNYLIPVDAELSNAGVVRFRALAADEVLASMEDAGARVNLFFLDACRDNPLPQVSRSLNRGLAPATTRPPETMIVYATGANDVAADGLGRNSPFTTAFLNHISTPGLELYDFYRNVAVDVHEATGGEQRPELFGNVTQRVSLIAPDTAPAMPPSFDVDRNVGSIRVTVEMAGTIYMDGERIGGLDAGRTAMLSDVATGTRQLEVRYDDGERQQEQIRVHEGRTTRAAFDHVERLEPAERVYRIGDRGPAGGYIFFVDENDEQDWTYLELSPTELEMEGPARLGGDIMGDLREAERLGHENGAGLENTVIIAEAFSSIEDDVARTALELEFGGYDDWFLPSVEELRLVYANLGDEALVEEQFDIPYNTSTYYLRVYPNGRVSQMGMWSTPSGIFRPIRAF